MEASSKNIHIDIIDRCKKGDPNAQYELYKLYSRAMYNISFRLINNREEAEDVLQESFLSAFNKISSYRSDASFGAWLKRIVINNSINQIRKKRIEFTELLETHEAIESKETNNDFSLNLNVERIRECIQQLPEGFRTVLSLYLLEGYDHKEIAEVLGIAESTSKSQFMRAKRKLKSML